jgi:ketosteroid isomerase-like protein
MSEENVEAFKRALDAANRQDIEAALEEIDPEVEWHAAIQTLGEAGVYRGHEALRELNRSFSGAFAEVEYEFPEIRDLGDRVLAVGRMRARGLESGVATESPWAFLVRFKNGKVIWVRAFLDPREALEAAGLQE